MVKKFICKICSKEFNDKNDYMFHIFSIHKFSYKDYYLKYECGGKIPLCKCGCNSQVSWDFDHFNEYLPKHFLSTQEYKNKLSEGVKKAKKKITQEQQEEINNRRRKTNLKKYGVAYVSQVKEINDKVKDAWENKSKEEIDERNKKIKQTKLERYGDENYHNVEKMKQTNIELGGNACSMNRSDIAPKIKADRLERTGYEHNWSDPISRNKMKQTKLEKYGDENYSNLEQTQKTLIDKYGVNAGFLIGKNHSKYHKHSKAEKIIHSSTADKFSKNIIIENREFDSYHKKSNTLIEIDGEYYHSKNILNLHFEQLNSIFNDMLKTDIANRNNFNLIRIRSESIKENHNYTIEELYKLQYFQDFKYNENSRIMTKEYLTKFISNKEEKDLIKYKQLLTTFINRLFKIQVSSKIIDILFEGNTDLTLQNIINLGLQ